MINYALTRLSGVWPLGMQPSSHLCGSFLLRVCVHSPHLHMWASFQHVWALLVPTPLVKYPKNSYKWGFLTTERGL